MFCFNCGMRIYKGDDKECRICGVKFAHKCKNCGSPNPAMANFCLNCSARLTKIGSQKSLRDVDL
jgi:adenylate cyclase